MMRFKQSMSEDKRNLKYKISVVSEEAENEKRVILLPEHIKLLTNRGYNVIVEDGLGKYLGCDNEQYISAGAHIVKKEDAWQNGDLIIKYKAPVQNEYKYIKENCCVAALCHAEGNYSLIKEFIDKKCTVFSFEFFETSGGYFPLAIPGGQIAGKVAMIYALYYSQTQLGGSGKLPVKVSQLSCVTIGVIGYGNVGSSIIKMALDLGNNVILFGRNVDKMNKFAAVYSGRISCFECTEENLWREIKNIDILFGAILISTYSTKPIVTEDMILSMKKGSIIVDVTCGYGNGYMPFIKNKTTLQDPVTIMNDRLFIKIDNLPAAYHYTSTIEYSNQVSQYIDKLCRFVFEGINDTTVKNGMIIKNGTVVHNVLKEHLTYYEGNIL